MPNANKLAAVALGARGQLIAEKTAHARGWEVYRRNARWPFAEIDLALQRTVGHQRHLLVLEVKTARHEPQQLDRLWPKHQQQRLWQGAAVLAEDLCADVVQVALVVVTLRRDSEHVLWLEAEPF